MSAHAVITHALNQGVFPARLVMISAGEGALMEIDSHEIATLRNQGMAPVVVEVIMIEGDNTPLAVDVPPHVYSVGTAPARVSLVKVAPEYHACDYCGAGDPLYAASWNTPGAWWGDTHTGRYCYACLRGRGVSEGWAVPRTAGVSLRKAGDRPQGDVVLCAPYGDGTAPEMRVTLAKVPCDWCQPRVSALFSAVSFAEGSAWVERFCKHHAYRFGAFRPVGFVESV